MRIKLTDGAEAVRLPSWRPPQVAAELAAEAKQVVTVLLSEETRALTATLSRSLSDIPSSRLTDVLTQEDRLLIAWASELATAEGLDPAEVAHLTQELGRYRAQELAGQRPELGVENTRAAAARIVALPSFTPREEAQARAILFGLATTKGGLDAGFVRTLLDPVQRGERSVSLTFVQRMVAALPPGSSEAAATLDVVYAQRDARVALAGALEKLALPTDRLATPTPERVIQGADLLRERAGKLSAEPWRWLASLTRNDRALLGLLYTSQSERGGSLRPVDDVTRALVALRSPGVQQERAGVTSGVVPTRANTMRPVEPPAISPRPSMVPAPRTFAEATTEEPVLQHGFGSAIQLAAKAAVAYRSVAPPRPISVPPPALRELPFVPTTPGEIASTAVPPFNLVQALGLSALVADVHTVAMRARQKRFKLRRELAVEAAAVVVAASAREASPETEHDPAHNARTHARWRRLLKKRLSSR